MHEYFSREQLAGYNTKILSSARILLIGAGALGNNVAQCLSLAGVGELLCCDNDYVEASNLTRSPLFAPIRERSRSHKSNKAKELALSALQLSYAENPVVRYAPTKLEALGLGALLSCDVVVSAVDSAAVRATIAEWTRLLGIPLVEAGFSGLRGSISAYRNHEVDEPCYGCLNPSATPERVSCRTYAVAVAAEGQTPATQTIAALMGALVSETAIRFLHRDYSLAGRVFSIDSSSWHTTTMRLRRDPACHCAHRRIDRIEKLAVTSKDRVSAIFDSIEDLIEPELRLPAPFVASLPCVACGDHVKIAKPQWQFEGAPRCTECAPRANSMPGDREVYESVSRNTPLARMQCHRVGLASRSIVEVYDRASQLSHWIQLDGTLDDLYITRTRKKERLMEGYPSAIDVMEQCETEESFRIL